jgi:hypothetical protein
MLDEEPERGGKISSPRTTVAALRTCGWQGGDIATLTGLDTNEVELVIEHDTRESKTRAWVKEIARPSELGLTAPMTLEQARAFAERMKAHLAT